MDELIEPVVQADWLRAHMRENILTASLKIVDASWRLPGSDHISAYEAFRQRRIPGAMFFDLDEVRDASSPLPHMAPTPEIFEAEMERLGIDRGDRIIVYDDAGLFSAARVWWTFQRMGHPRVSVLDGGLPAWIAIGGHLETGAPRKQEALRKHDAPPRPSRPGDLFAIAFSDDVRAALENRTARVIDARPAARFAGLAPEPRPGLRRGSMPGAVNLPFSALLDPVGRLVPDERLREILAGAGILPHTPVIATCGSGVTAAIIILALAKLGYSNHALYDGAWAEWGSELNDPALFPVVRSKPADGRQD